MSSFLKPWKSEKSMENLDTLLTLVMYMVLAFIFINFPEETRNPLIFLVILIPSTVWQLSKSEGYVSGGTVFRWLSLAGGGLLLGGIIVLIKPLGYSLATPFSVGDVGTTALAVVSSAIYGVVFAPFVEEKIFGQTLPYFLNYIFGNSTMGGRISLIITSISFGAFHWLAYGANIGSMLYAMTFRGGITILNNELKSSGFGYGAHLANNMLVFITR